MEEDIERFKVEKKFQFHQFDKIFQRILPPETEKRDITTLNEYILQEDLASRELYAFIHAVQIVYKTIANKLGRFNLQKIGDTYLIKEEKKLPGMTNEQQFVQEIEDLFINVVGDTGLVDYMNSKYTKEIIKIECKIPGNYMLCFSILDGKRNLKDHLPVGSIFALYRLDPESSLDLKELTGNTIVSAGFAVYGTCTLLLLAFRHGQGIHEFYLDQSIGEFTLGEPNKRISRRGVFLSINEGITAGWDEATKIFVNRRKDPRFIQPTKCFYFGTPTADIARTIKGGGIYMNPSNVKYPEGKMCLLYESNPMAHVLREAGGYATDGVISILDIEPNGQRQKVPFIGGSMEDVLNFMELKTIYRAREYK